MTKPFSIPEAPTDEYLEDHISSEWRLLGAKELRDIMLPHREASVMMFEVLNHLQKTICSPEQTCECEPETGWRCFECSVASYIRKALADVEKIYNRS